MCLDHFVYFENSRDGEWILVGSMPYNILRHTAVTTRGGEYFKVYLFGGKRYTENGAEASSLEALIFDGISWEFGKSMMTSRYGHRTVHYQVGCHGSRVLN